MPDSLSGLDVQTRKRMMHCHNRPDLNLCPKCGDPDVRFVDYPLEITVKCHTCGHSQKNPGTLKGARTKAYGDYNRFTHIHEDFVPSRRLDAVKNWNQQTRRAA